MVRLAPGPSVPRPQGNATVQSPVFEGKPSPGGVWSVTTTLLAADGPRLVTTMVNVRSLPAVALGGPDFVTTRSADAAIAVASESLSLPGTGSGVSAGGATLALLTRVPVAVGSTVPVATKVAEPPAGRATVVAMSPLPAATPPLHPWPRLHLPGTPLSTPGDAAGTPAPLTA